MLLVLAAAALSMAATSPAARAQNSRELAERHPASQVVVQFLRYSVNREYNKSAGLITPASLEKLKRDYVAKVKSPRTGLDEATALCRAVGVEEEGGIDVMTPVEFYTAYNQGVQRRYKVTDEMNRRIADSLELNMLSVAEEGPDLVHFLVRTLHRTPANEVSHLEIISLVRVDNRWLVSLDEKEPKYTPLKPASGAAAPAPATPQPPTAPAQPSPPK